MNGNQQLCTKAEKAVSEHKTSGCDCRFAELIESHDKKGIGTLCKIYDAACRRRFEVNTAKESKQELKWYYLKRV